MIFAVFMEYQIKDNPVRCGASLQIYVRKELSNYYQEKNSVGCASSKPKRLSTSQMLSICLANRDFLDCRLGNWINYPST